MNLLILVQTNEWTRPEIAGREEKSPQTRERLGLPPSLFASERVFREQQREGAVMRAGISVKACLLLLFGVCSRSLSHRVIYGTLVRTREVF